MIARWLLVAGLLAISVDQLFAVNEVALPGMGTVDAGDAAPYLSQALEYRRLGFNEWEIAELENAIGHARDPKVKAICYAYCGGAYSRVKRYDKAMRNYEEALKLDPEALAYFERGMKISPHHDELLNSFAWFRSTCPDRSFRNGIEATRMAKEACERTKWRNVNVIDTLAAAEAEAGYFEAAASVDAKILEHKDLTNLGRKEIEERVQQYKNHEAFRRSIR
ncbi:MAG: hypothetical protein DMF04_12700 [Verrucomicrobia bacterium]|nr:MAG: hypothetical protein DMF04_12700 [Verrucomicrobiota bacterium]